MDAKHQTNYLFPGLSDILNDCSIDRVMAINHQWEIIAWNATSELLTGLNRQSLVGQELTEVFPVIADDPEMMSAIESAFAGSKTYVPSAAGRFNRHYMENHFIPLKSADGQLMAVINIMYDVSHRLKAEMELCRVKMNVRKKSGKNHMIHV